MTQREDWPSLKGCFALTRDVPTDDTPWRFTSWWILLDDWRAELLFGWSFAWDAGPSQRGQWQIAYQRKLNIRRLDLHASHKSVFELLRRLAAGDSLAEAAAIAGFAEAMPEVQKFLQKCSLGTAAKVSAKGSRARGDTISPFVVAPWRLLPSRDSFVDGPASPIGDAPAMRSAFVRVDKTHVLPKTDEQARAVLDYLVEDCGLSFKPIPGRNIRDLGRLGDLEVLLFAAPDWPQVQVKAGEDFIVVEVAATFVGVGNTAYLRCRQTHGGAVLSESMQLLPESDPNSLSRTARFETLAMGPSGAEIELWVAEPNSVECRLVHAHDYAWIRQIGFSLAMMGTQVQFPAEWIDDWVKQRRKHAGGMARADAMRRVTSIVHDSDSRVGKDDERWHTAETNADKLAKHLSPPSSGAVWIGRGADGTVDHGKVSVAEWFRSMVAEARTSRSYLIVDPYFYTLGLDLLARASGPGRSFVVVTTLDNRDNPDEKRRTLQAQLRQLKIALPHLRVEMRFVNDRRIHDRMIFELEPGPGKSDPVPVRGFHLSNSLQRATDNYPLLITPIPRDILADVIDGVAALIESLVPLPEDERTGRETATQTVVTDDGERGARRNLDSEPQDLDALDRRLRAAVEACDALAFGESLTAYLQSRDQQGLGRGSDADEAWARQPAFLAMLEARLEAGPTKHRSHDTQQAIGLAQLTKRCSFEEWKDPSVLWTHGHWSFSSDIVFYAGLPRLFDAAPDRVIRVWERFCEPVAEPESTDQQVQRGAALEAILELMQRHFHLWGEQEGPEREGPLKGGLVAGLGSRSLFIRRALAAQLGLLMLERNWSLAQGREIIEMLGSARERVFTIAGWVYKLRIHGNRSNVESLELAELRKEWMAWMVEWWPSTLEQNDLHEIVTACEGPGGPGAWAASTTNDLLLPLHEKGQLRADSLADIWLGMLEERLERLVEDKHHFHAPADIRLSEVCVWLYVKGDDSLTASSDEHSEALERRLKECLTRLDKLSKRVMATRSRPFLSSLHYSVWNAADMTRVWLCALALMLKLSPGVPEHVRLITGSWISDQGIRGKAENDPLRLFWWAEQLLDRCKEAEDSRDSAGRHPSPDES